jgi:DNA-binding GntR family transcriptional regulator
MLLRDRIYQGIRQSILSCELRPGQDLREQVLAERYRVSRSPIRDALLRLEQERLIIVLPRQGYRVTPISLASHDEITGLRRVIEPACAAAAAARARDAPVGDLDPFRAGPGNMYVSYADYNDAFHKAVASLCGNARMAAVAIDLVDQYARFVHTGMLVIDPVSVDHLVAEHCLIIDAIQARDADRAADLSRKHVTTGSDVVLANLHQIKLDPDKRMITD